MPVYHYAIPVEEDAEGVKTPMYEPNVRGQQYLYHYGEHHLHIIQEEPARKFHRSSVAVSVTVHTREAIEEAKDSGTLVEEFI